MQGHKSSLRRFFSWLLLFALILGALGGAGLSVFAAPVSRPLVSCSDGIITQWTFTNVTTPSTGTGTFSVGTGIEGPTFLTDSSLDSPSISFTRWDTAVLDNTDFEEFFVDTTNRSSIAVSFKYRSSVTGPTTLELHYSTDGSTFIPFGSPLTLTTDSTFYNLSFDLASIPALDNNPNAKFRLYAYGASASDGILRIDNFTVKGNCPYSPLMLVINEVAWAGTKASEFDEWIELFNPGSTPIDLSTGWKIEAADGDPSIPLTGIIGGGNYYLLERSDSLVTSANEDQIYSGSLLSDTGEILYLLAPDRSVVDTANSDGGAWPAGKLSTTSSMQRGSVIADSNSAWITYDPSYESNLSLVSTDAANNDVQGTPGRANVPNNATATFTPTVTPTATATSTPPPSDPLTIIISEVAWGGTVASPSDEWIELYNPGNKDIDLTGWVLSSTDGTPRIDDEFDGVILEAKEYLLLEAEDDSTVYFLPADYTCPSIIFPSTSFSGVLNNTGESLRLYDETGAIVDTANSNGGSWPAGSARNYTTMQRSLFETDNDLVWVTYEQSRDTADKFAQDADENPIRGTPCRANLPFNVTPTFTPAPTRTPIRSTGSTTTLQPILVISEFLPRPGTDWNNDGKVDVFDEFIEVINGGSINVTLSSYRLDDEEDEGSSPFALPNLTLAPGERAVFYAADTGIMLSDAGDTVRLLRGSTVVDAYTYDFARYPDQSWCRPLESYGDWVTPCFPTPNNPNALTGTLPLPSKLSPQYYTPACLMSDTAPEAFVYAECEAPGGGIWNRQFWDGSGFFQELIVEINQRLTEFFE